MTLEQGPGPVEPGEETENVRAQIIESGIAERMLRVLKRDEHQQGRKMTYGVEDCDFWVEVSEEGPEEDIRGGEQVGIVIKHPNLGPNKEKELRRVRQRFNVKEERGFGLPSEEPLTAEQYQLVQSIVAKIKKAKQQSEG